MVFFLYSLLVLCLAKLCDQVFGEHVDCLGDKLFVLILEAVVFQDILTSLLHLFEHALDTSKFLVGFLLVDGL